MTSLFRFRLSRALALAALLLVLLTNFAKAAELTFGEGGVGITVKGMGDFTLSYPVLQPGDKQPLEKRVSGQHAELKYAGGVKLAMELTAGGKLELRFQDVGDLQKFQMGLLLGPQYADGGSWTIGQNELKSFPKDKPEKPILYQGNAGSFLVKDVSGHTLAISGLPDYAFNQLQDNREWGWKIFQWQVWVPYNAGWAVHSLVINEGSADGAPAKIQPQVDRLGQSVRKDYPGKVKDEAELKADVPKEAAYYASFKPLATDRFGGLPGTRGKFELQATGLFHTEKHGERWLLVDPDGNAYFHLGVCAFGCSPGEDFTYVRSREDTFEWLPPVAGEFARAWHPDNWWHDQAFSFYVANLIRKYGAEYVADPDRHMSAMVDRVRRFGFNAAGAFSANTKCFTEKSFPRMEFCGAGPELPGIRGVSDPFDADTLDRMDKEFGQEVAASAKDPLIIGYFFANEQAFEDIPRGVPLLNGRHAAKHKLVEQLRQKYLTIAELDQAWGLQVTNFADLLDQGLPVQTPAAFADMKAYTEVFLDTYYRTITETFRKYDHNHLMVGNRWQPGTANDEALCRAAGKYMDVISVNYYTLGVDKAFIGRVHQWTGDKPMLWSEFYYTSSAESSCGGANADMATQKGRGQAYRQYVEQGASLGYVVGIEWFTLIDQAVSGRWFEKLNGERCNTGLFSVTDRPYQDMVEEMAIANRDVYPVWLADQQPYVINDPRFNHGTGEVHKLISAGRVANGSIKVDGSTSGWPGRPPERIGGDRLVLGKDAEGFEAAFKVCWDDQNFYLLAKVADPTPMCNDQTGVKLWAGDSIELFVGSEKLDQGGSLLYSDHQVLLGAKAKPKAGDWFIVNAPRQVAIALSVAPTVDGKGYSLEAAIPWRALNVAPKEGQELLFDMGVNDAPPGGDRSRQLMWNGGERNSGDRSQWGRLQLVP
jgi:hypothetical protein